MFILQLYVMLHVNVELSVVHLSTQVPITLFIRLTLKLEL